MRSFHPCHTSAWRRARNEALQALGTPGVVVALQGMRTNFFQYPCLIDVSTPAVPCFALTKPHISGLQLNLGSLLMAHLLQARAQHKSPSAPSRQPLLPRFGLLQAVVGVAPSRPTAMVPMSRTHGPARALETQSLCSPTALMSPRLFQHEQERKRITKSHLLCIPQLFWMWAHTRYPGTHGEGECPTTLLTAHWRPAAIQTEGIYREFGY